MIRMELSENEESHPFGRLKHIRFSAAKDGPNTQFCYSRSYRAGQRPLSNLHSGRICTATPRPKQDGELALRERWFPIQVKQKDKAGRPDIDSFQAVMMREECEKGFFISFAYSQDAHTECQNFFKRTGKVIIPLTVREILDEQIAHKLV